MGNILDYLQWRGDIPFSVDAFNEVDNLILAELAYLNFLDTDSKDSTVSLNDVRLEFDSSNAALSESEDQNKRNRELLFSELKKAPRFQNTKICAYVNELDKDRETQFAAVTFLLEDGSAYVAFRGTDSSFVGWKESLDLSYLPEIEGHRQAINYLNSLSLPENMPLRVGGHSKGGNLAIYAAAFCYPTVRKRIIEVYTNDGPGFTEEIIQSEEYQSLLSKINYIIPDASVIGRLMLNESVPRIVRSTALGIGQHNGFTWCVDRNRFERTEISEMGIFLDRSVSDWADQMDGETRRSLILSIFTLLEGTGKENFQEIKEQKRKTLEAVLSGINALPNEKRQELFHHARQLIHSGSQTARTELSQYIENTLNEKNPPPDPETRKKLAEAFRLIQDERKTIRE